jgi:hypothetical protein
MTWNMVVVDPAKTWLHSLRATDPETLIQISAALTVLRRMGPTLGAPLAKPVKSSQFGNMRELRPGSAKNTEIRILYAFNPAQTAVILVGGDKSSDWDGWYKISVPIADSEYREHLNRITETH